MPHPQFTPADVERFWSLVDQSGDHWLWTGRTDPRGYGIFILHSRNVRAHRFALMLAGVDLSGGLWALHTCDTPGCVRNDDVGEYIIDGVSFARYGHLFPGTNLDNMRDAHQKGRLPTGDRNPIHTHPEKRVYGERNGKARLTEETVVRIRELSAEGMSPSLSNCSGMT